MTVVAAAAPFDGASNPGHTPAPRPTAAWYLRQTQTSGCNVLDSAGANRTSDPTNTTFAIGVSGATNVRGAEPRAGQLLTPRPSSSSGSKDVGGPSPRRTAVSSDILRSASLEPAESGAGSTTASGPGKTTASCPSAYRTRYGGPPAAPRTSMTSTRWSLWPTVRPRTHSRSPTLARITPTPLEAHQPAPARPQDQRARPQHVAAADPGVRGAQALTAMLPWMKKASLHRACAAGQAGLEPARPHGAA